MPMAVSLACALVVCSWCVLWLVPFLRSVPTLPLIVWSAALSTYFVWYLHARGYPWQAPGWIIIPHAELDGRVHS